MVTDRQLARAGAGGGGGGGPTLAMSERHEQYWHTGAVTPATRSCRGAGEQLQIFSAVILSFRGGCRARAPRRVRGRCEPGPAFHGAARRSDEG